MMRVTPALRELDAMVVNVELTLTSIIQGVALYFLTENTRAIFNLHDWSHWLYVIAGLLIIFVFWSRSILHTLTVIRWPLEFGHNFFYFACALGESLLFCHLENPRVWFGGCAIYAVIIWGLFFYDLRIVMPREVDLLTEASRKLCQLIEVDQRRNLRWLIPALFFFHLACFVALQKSPRFFLAGSRHIYLVAAQVIGLAGYLCYVIRLFRQLGPLMASRQEERRALAEDD